MAALAALGTAIAANAGTISTIATVAGTAVSAMGTIAAGKSQQQSANYEALQLEAQGKERQAAARVEADEEKRRKELAQSRVTAVAAASGFTATDPTTLQIGEDIEEYGTLKEQMAVYGGTNQRAGLEGQAAARRYEGQVAKQNARYGAASTILGGISSLATRFSPRGAAAASTSPYRYG